MCSPLRAEGEHKGMAELRTPRRYFVTGLHHSRCTHSASLYGSISHLVAEVARATEGKDDVVNGDRRWSSIHRRASSRRLRTHASEVRTGARSVGALRAGSRPINTTAAPVT